MASFGIGAKLRQERVGRGLAIDDISRDTRIAPRFLEAIETEEYSALPGLIFTRNFVRQYAVTLNLDPDPLLAELPKHDESTAQLPNPPARPRSNYHRDRRRRALISATVWILLAGGAGGGAYFYFKHSTRASASQRASSQPVSARSENPPPRRTDIEPASDITSDVQQTLAAPAAAFSSATAPVQVSLTTHDQSAWIQVSVDGRITFSGMLKPNETREVSASEQVKILTGNAGGLTISLNGKTLDSIGPVGQVRSVMLTAEGSQFLATDSPRPPDPL
ncbi:MAG TPA: RodZ domain-containing protein [Bryobacteraceae bacterium]